MAAITSNIESWNNHKFSEVEENIKKRFGHLTNGHDYVDIGGYKWATMNIGATEVTDVGLYFQWGDTTGYENSDVGTIETSFKKQFTWADYKFGNGTSDEAESAMTKYNEIDGKDTLDYCDDAARVNWGGGWKIPSYSQYTALTSSTNATYVTNYQGSGVDGCVLTDKTDYTKFLFFPRGGYISNGTWKDTGLRYWTRSHISSEGYIYARRFLYNAEGTINVAKGGRYSGFLIRAVLSEGT